MQAATRTAALQHCTPRCTQTTVSVLHTCTQVPTYDRSYDWALGSNARASPSWDGRMALFSKAVASRRLGAEWRYPWMLALLAADTPIRDRLMSPSAACRPHLQHPQLIVQTPASVGILYYAASPVPPPPRSFPPPSLPHPVVQHLCSLQAWHYLYSMPAGGSV